MARDFQGWAGPFLKIWARPKQTEESRTQPLEPAQLFEPSNKGP